MVEDSRAAERGEMSFWGHLEVLRWSLFRITIVVGVLMIFLFMAMPSIFGPFVLGPTSSDFFLYKWLGGLGSPIPFMPDFSASDFKVSIVNINVASQFMTHISTSFWFALVISFPYSIYEIWRFVSPGLYDSEKRGLRVAFLFGTIMFFIGCIVGYCFIFPFTFRFLAEYNLSNEIVNNISLNSYMSIFMTMVFVMGLVFEMPLLAWVLSSFGLLTKMFLKKYRKFAVVILLVAAALITPTGDPFTLMLVFLPLYLLYELSILLVRK